MGQSTVFTVGLDVHKLTIAACWLRGQEQTEESREIPNDPKAIRRLFERLTQQGRVRACYEAGPCGYEVHRQLEAMGIGCEVIAPSLIPIRPGDRVKNDRRDARKLARLYRAGELTAIRVPGREDEAARDLLRCREALVQDTTRRRHRVLKFLLRHGRSWTEGRNWTQAHWSWIRRQAFDLPQAQRAFEEYIYQLDHNVERLRSLEAHIERLATEEPWRVQVARLRCFRGIDTLTAMTMLTEIQDFRRFESPRQLMSFVGMTPSIHDSGGSHHSGPITKSGNAHMRRVVVEAAWHYRHKPRIGYELRKRTEGQSDWVIELATKAQRRLYQRYTHFDRQGKRSQIGVVAVARELLGFIWALMTDKRA